MFCEPIGAKTAAPSAAKAGQAGLTDQPSRLRTSRAKLNHLRIRLPSLDQRHQRVEAIACVVMRFALICPSIRLSARADGLDAPR